MLRLGRWIISILFSIRGGLSKNLKTWIIIHDGSATFFQTFLAKQNLKSQSLLFCITCFGHPALITCSTRSFIHASNIETGGETPTQEYSWHHGEQLHTGSNFKKTIVMILVGRVRVPLVQYFQIGIYLATNGREKLTTTLKCCSCLETPNTYLPLTRP